MLLNIVVKCITKSDDMPITSKNAFVQWEIDMQKEVENIRKENGKLVEMNRGKKLCIVCIGLVCIAYNGH